MKNQHGRVVDASERAETLAEHLEHVQWAVRPDTIPSLAPPLFDFQHMRLDDFTKEELEHCL